MKVKSSDLTGIYSKTTQAGDNPKLIKLDAFFFDRHEEYEVIDMIEKVLKRIGQKKEYIEMIEGFIKQLDPNMRSREHVYQWLVKRSERMIDIVKQWNFS